MVPPDSDRVSPAPPYSGFHYFGSDYQLQDYHLLRCSFPTVFDCLVLPSAYCGPTTPWYCRKHQYWFGLFPVRSPLLRKSLLFSLPAGYLDVSVLLRLLSLRNILLRGMGCPIRTSSDRWAACTYPKLFAACHVLHRLQMPRHPPYTLTYFSSILCAQDSIDSIKYTHY